ncbi:MAG: HEAT repeat domain-containing protein [Phycisphaerae bacterium]|nr:HEAT repeat domain-containing protein [Phycisphaerae bacterium]
MPRRTRAFSARLALAVALVTTAASSVAVAQDFSGVSAALRPQWEAALEALVKRDTAAVETAFGAMLEADVSPFRVALLADEATRRGKQGGGVLLLEQDAKNGKLGENGQKIAAMLDTGREQMNQADDGFYFAAVGRFDVAAANFNALVESNPDPVAVLEFTESRPQRRRILAQVVTNPVCGDAARGMLRLLNMGEAGVKADARRVRANIERLKGPPRGFENAVENLRESGEYAVPVIIEYLQNPEKRDYLQPILRALPELNRTAVNGLVVALETEDDMTRLYLVDALGKMGYAQAIPYLLRLRDSDKTSSQVRSAAELALAAIRAKSGVGAGSAAADSFTSLADQYYKNSSSLAADPRSREANVWYWKEGGLRNVRVPTEIYDEVMAMRCSEYALMLQPDNAAALPIWIAANFRRAAELPAETTDATRPENDPAPAYYAQSAGPKTCLAALDRALKHNESVVALGCIEALRNTAGPQMLIAGQAAPLGESLTFADRLVRIQAALALGRATPRETFNNHQNLLTVLGEAVQLAGAPKGAIVVDADDRSANAAASALRANGYEVISDANLNGALAKARTQLPSVDAIVLASNIQNPPMGGAIQQIRQEFRFRAAPILLLQKEGDESAVDRIVTRDERIARMPQSEDPALVKSELERLAGETGAAAVEASQARTLALEAAQVLEGLGQSREAKLFDMKLVEGPLLAAMKSSDAEVRQAMAEALAYVPTEAAQDAIASAALDAALEEPVRASLFDALAAAGRANGTKLSSGMLAKLVETASKDATVTMREAASRALGAANTSGNTASEIIRAQHRG